MFKNAIVLTGGIATGKSTVANILKKAGFNIIDADKIAHTVLDINYEKISNLFGKQYIKNKKVDRKELGKLIFKNENEKLKLENLLHPLIKTNIIKQAKIFENNNKVYFIDIPLFFEKNNYNIKRSLVIYINKEEQVKRLIKRDKFNVNDALARIDAQIDIEKKKNLATFVIDNSNSIDDLEVQIKKLKDVIL